MLINGFWRVQAQSGYFVDLTLCVGKAALAVEK